MSVPFFVAVVSLMPPAIGVPSLPVSNVIEPFDPASTSL